MRIDIPIKNAIRKIVREAIVKNDRTTLRLINLLKRRVLKLEEKSLAKNIKIYPKSKPTKSILFPKRK